MVEQYLGDTHYDYDAYIEDGWINQNIDCIFEQFTYQERTQNTTSNRNHLWVL